MDATVLAELPRHAGVAGPLQPRSVTEPHDSAVPADTTMGTPVRSSGEERCLVRPATGLLVQPHGFGDDPSSLRRLSVIPIYIPRVHVLERDDEHTERIAR